MISIVTPWLDASELCPIYESTCAWINTISHNGYEIDVSTVSDPQRVEVIVIDNGSQQHHANAIKAMVNRMNGKYIRNETNQRFSKANNQGLEIATGGIVVFMNNDVEGRGIWLTQVERDVKPGALYGPVKSAKALGGRKVPYIEGFCIAATRDTWDMLGGWDETLPGMYWEDNELCWRAARMGIGLIETTWPVYHYGNYTSAKTPGAYDHSAENQAELSRRILESDKNLVRAINET